MTTANVSFYLREAVYHPALGLILMFSSRETGIFEGGVMAAKIRVPTTDEQEVREMLQAYLRSRGSE